MDHVGGSQPARKCVAESVHQRPRCHAEWRSDQDRNCQLLLRQSAAAEREMRPGDYVSLGGVRYRNGHDRKRSLNAPLIPFTPQSRWGRGPGLGLSMIYGFAKQSGGQVRIDRSLDVGRRSICSCLGITSWRVPQTRSRSHRNQLELPRAKQSSSSMTNRRFGC